MLNIGDGEMKLKKKTQTVSDLRLQVDHRESGERAYNSSRLQCDREAMDLE